MVHSSNRAGAVNLWLMPVDGGKPVRLTSGTGPDDVPAVARDGTMVFVNSRWRHTLLVQNIETGATHEHHQGSGILSPDGKLFATSSSCTRAMTCGC